MFKNKNFQVSFVVVLMACFFMAISFVNHYFLRTSALDLGMFNQALYCFSEGKMNYFTLDISNKAPLYFADHFSPITVLYVPFYYVFGHWTLIIIQVVLIVLAGLAIYKISMYRLKSHSISLLCMFIFYSNWSIVSALAYDFHNNVVAAMLLPWVFWWYLKENKILVLIGVFLMLLAKENTGLWVSFIFLGLALQKWWINRTYNLFKLATFELLVVLCSISYFVVINGYVMPSLNFGNNVQLNRYVLKGESLNEKVWDLFAHPARTFSYFFINTATPVYDFFKRDFHLVVLLSGGIFLLIRPLYLWMLLPIYAQKMLSLQPSLWGVGGHYSIEFSVIIILSVISGIALVKQQTYKIGILVFLTILTCAVNFHLVNGKIHEYLDRPYRDYTYSSHYKAENLDVNYIKEIIHSIPNEASVSTVSCLAPRLEKRQRLYSFPIINDAEFILIIDNGAKQWPLTYNQLKEEIGFLKSSKYYHLIHNKKDLLIFKRKTNKQKP